MSIENNPLLSEYRKKLKNRHRTRMLLYCLVAFCGFGWASNWYYGKHEISLVLTIIAVGYLLVKFPTKQSLLEQDKANPKYQVFAKVLITERQQRLSRKNEADKENMKTLEDYLSKMEDKEK